MRVPVRSLPLLLAAMPALAWAQAADLGQGNDSIVYARAVSAADYPGEDYVVLLEEGHARFESDGRRRVTFRQVVQLLTQSGVTDWGELEYGYDSSRTRFLLDRLRVVTPEGTVASDGPAHTQESSPDVPVDLPVYTDERIRRFSVAGLEPGRILDVSYTLDTHRPALPSDFRFRWVFTTGPSTLESRFVVDLPEAVTPRVRAENVPTPPRESTADGRRVLEWRAESIPAVEWESLAGTPNTVIGFVTVSAPLTWDSVAAWYHALSADRQEVTDDIRDALPDILVGAWTARDTLLALHRWIAQDLRYVSLALGDGGYRPRSPAEVYDTKFGDCKDKTTLFVAILGALGIDAYPVLTHTGTPIDSLSPTAARFSHMIAAVETSRGLEFADLTSGTTPFGRLPYDLQGAVGLLVRPDGSGRIVVFPEDDPSTSLRTVSIAGEVAADGSLSGAVSVTTTGLEETWLRELTAGATEMDAAELRSLGEEIATHYLDGAVVDSTQALDGLDLWSSPAVVAWIHVPQLVTTSANRRVLPLPLPEYSMDALRDELERDSVRQFPIDVAEFNGPSVHRTEVTFTLPPGWRAELPPDVEVAGTFGHYRSAYTQQGRTVRAVRELAGRRGLEPPDSVAALTAWLRAVGADRARYLVIEEAAGIATRDSLAGVSSFQLAFGWPVGMEARVRQRATQVRALNDAPPDSTTSETAYRMHVREHELGRRLEFSDFTVTEQSEGYRPGFQGLIDRVASWMPGFVVDEHGTFLGIDSLDRFLEIASQAMRPLMDSAGVDQPGIRAILERTLTPEFYNTQVEGWWATLVYSWSDTEMELGVAYTGESDEPSPLFPDRTIRYNQQQQLASRVPCRSDRADSACVRLLANTRADPTSVKNLLTELFAEMLRNARTDVPVLEAMDVRNTIELTSEPEALIPHALTTLQEVEATMRDSTGTRFRYRQVRRLEYWFEYGEFHAVTTTAADLLAAAAAGDVTAATEALRGGAEVEQRDPLGRTPLMVASANGHEAVVRLLLFRGANVAATDRTGRSAVLWAAVGDHDTVLGHLLQAGGSLDEAYGTARDRAEPAAIPALRRAGLPAPGPSAPTLIDSARTVYNGGALESALPLFVDAAAADTASADALAWVAELQRRLGRTPEAVATARLALVRDACHGHALSVIADAVDPQFGIWPGANADSAWHYSVRAVECAPEDGNGWLSLVFRAAARGDETREHEALRRLVSTGFLTPSMLATGRWMLETLPDSALLLTGGDMDTYPLLALQEVEGVRRDVAVLNTNLLNLAWYRAQMVGRHGLPDPETCRDLLSVWKGEIDEAAPATDADTTIALWRAASLEGRLARPVAVSLSALTFDDPHAGPGELSFRAAAGLVVDSAGPPDAEAAYGYFAGLDARDFRGSTTSPSDRSALRQSWDVRGLVPFGAMLSTMGFEERDWLSTDTTTIRAIVRVLRWTEGFTRESEHSNADFWMETLAEAYTDVAWGISLHRLYDEAIRLGKTAVALDADNARALSNVGYQSLHQGALDTAVVYAERAQAATPALGTLLVLVEANRLAGDLAAAARWGDEAEALAVGDRLEDETFMWANWTCDYFELAGAAPPPPTAVWLVTADDKLALLHYSIAVTDAAAGRRDEALAQLTTAQNLSPRADLQCVVYNRIDATVGRYGDRPEAVAALGALAERLTPREAACEGP